VSRASGTGVEQVPGGAAGRIETMARIWAGRTPPAWCLVVPVKPLPRAKTRLAAAAGPHREELALAFARDTVAAALACPRVAGVVVVTDDGRAAPVLRELGAHVVPDEPDAGLNPALEHGARHAALLRPGGGLGALSADLPALRPAELSTALAAAARYDRAFVPDVAGSGTTLLAAAPGVPFQPRFGSGSADRHRGSGAHELALDSIPSLRRDVDTEADLAAAVRLGVGPGTSAVLARLPGASLAGVQATVRSFSPDTRSGSVLLDDGVELPYDAAAFDAGGLRRLRLGQRVRIRTEGEGADQRVTLLTILTLP
jgi:2-phospho-L-lactate guanylyltransferase